MPFVTPDLRSPGRAPSRSLTYAMVAYDRGGLEAHDPDGAATTTRPHGPGMLRRAVRRVSDRTLSAGPGGEPAMTAPDSDERRLMSLELADRLRAARDGGEPYTDLFIASHGWLTDYERALVTYDAWFGACETVRPEAIDPDGPGKSMVVAVHWPSQPNTRSDEHAEDPIPLQDLPAGADRTDRAPKPRVTLDDLVDSVVPLASFFLMEHRASVVGREGVAPLIARLQDAGGPGLRIHLTGHSFGARVLVEALVDRSHHGVAPVDSLFLVEGAVSAWAFCAAADNPYGDPDGDGLQVIRRRMVRGPIIASTSRFDYALGKMFPAAHGLEVAASRLRALRFPFGRLDVPGQPAVPPRLGALGIWAFAGAAAERQEVLQRDTTTEYDFRAGALHHLVTDAVVDLRPYGGKDWDGPTSGSHSNIAHPELAAAYWQVVRAAAVRGA